MMSRLMSAVRTALPVAALFVTFQSIAAPTPIPSGSMEPTMRAGDILFVNKLAYSLHVPMSSTAELAHWSNPERGDIVVFNAPPQAAPMENLYIKRVVGLAGDVVEVRDHKLTLNGQPLQYREKDGVLYESLGKKPHRIATGPSPLADFGPYRVPAGHVFVMGDHRDNSSDSRVWGPLELNRLRGKADYRMIGLNPVEFKGPGAL